MAIKILKPGVLDTVQDLGRNGKRDLGINPNGAMDKTAVRFLNTLLHNDPNEATLEMHFPACKIEFEEDAVFAIGGADFNAKLDGKVVDLWKSYLAKKGQILSFKQKNSGNRTYLAIMGGFKIDDWLKSKSTNLIAKIGGVEGRTLKKNDLIEFNQTRPTKSDFSSERIARSLIPQYADSPTVRITKGNEYKRLTALSEQAFLSSKYKITSESNRMGFRLEGKPLHLLNDNELISSAVDFGTIQLLPDGQMAVLMTDHQTTGGYPRIGHVVQKDLPLLAQLGPGDSVGFYLIAHEEAEKLAVQFERDLSFLNMGMQFKNKIPK